MTQVQPLVSIIMPAYNAASYIKCSIESALAQTYHNWELLIVNDGSNDKTREIVQCFTDNRIHYFEKENGGVSSARNMALAKMQGEYFCFLDADDLLTPQSISSRIELFQQRKEVGIVDGIVIVTGENINNVLRVYKPSLSGRVTENFARLSEKVFCMPSAMVRRETGINYSFDPLMTHAEDIWFFLKIHQQSQLLFASVATPIVHYRRVGETAMNNLDGLSAGYFLFL